MICIWRIVTSVMLLVLLGCAGEKNYVFEAYDFQYQGNSWDAIPYQFSQSIESVVLKEKGSQFAATDYSNIGAYQKVLDTWDSMGGKRKGIEQEDIDEFREYKAVSARDIIIERSKDTQVTIVNEAHHIPLHRVFTQSLLRDLWDNGYRHFGLEAYFSSSVGDSTLVANGYPILTSGYYVKEPEMGNLIREALEIGYDVFGYESQGDNGPKERDINQAKNIQDYIATHPKGKVLIHCGYAHGSEGEYGGQWERTMAARLTEYTGIDPLTVDQTIYREMSGPGFENPYYALADVQGPSVFMKNETVFGKYKENTWFDLFVFHPRTENMISPEWLLYDDRELVNISYENEEINCPCMVLTYKSGEEIGRAVPYHVVEAAEKSVDVVIGDGDYTVIIHSHEGHALRTSVRR